MDGEAIVVGADGVAVFDALLLSWTVAKFNRAQAIPS
jgi:hypothetical protein